METEFKSFKKIERLQNQEMAITQKLHGTNAQIYIHGETVIAGSRSRYLSVCDDNYGFARFVEDRKNDLITLLGDGTHYGEWAGPGINSGEGLSKRSFYLFNHWYFFEKLLPEGVGVVPVLYRGIFDYSKIQESKDYLLKKGSLLVDGFMNVEGIVIQIGGILYKDVFKKEETAWEIKRERGIKPELVDVSHLLQPIRLEKLLSRDERYRINFPKSLPDIVKNYVQDLIDEGQITGTDDEVKLVKKSLGNELFRFVKENVN